MSRKSMLLLLTGVLVFSLVALVVPTFIRACTTSAINTCVSTLRILVGAKEQWAAENHRTTNDVPTRDDVRPYLSEGEMPTTS